MEIDHVIYAVRDLDAAAGRIKQEHGLDSYVGGSHPAFGTANRLIPTGDDYIELMGIGDPAVAALNPLGQFVTQTLQTGERPIGWVVRSDDIDADAARLGLEVFPGERAKPDGTIVRWRAVGLVEAFRGRSLPFFIAWDDPDTHPARTPVNHDNVPKGIAWVEVGGDQAALDAWLGTDAINARATGAEPGVHAFAVETARGEIVFR